EWAIMASAAIGSLAYAFTDTFWFSAVEAEVYALSSLFTAVVFWAMLKWERVSDEAGSNRWLILIAYLMGLSIGAHILNLLTIPALVFIFYFKKFPSRKRIDLWKPALIGVVLTGAFYIMTPTVIGIGAWFDRVFVNSFGLGVNSGLATFIVLLLLALGFGVWKTYKLGKALSNTILLSAAMVVIGFSTYGIVIIRSSANPPMNSNHPADPYTLKSFINREQYGSRPLIKGQTYASLAIDNELSQSYYVDKNTGKYASVESAYDYKYDPATEVFFPRMYSEKHAADYKNWAQVVGRAVRTSTGETVTIPTGGENLRFFFSYQLNHMYWRYFLWNFVGRQSDLQSSGNIDNGQWLSGVDFIDEMYLGPQDNLPSEIAANRGHNTYFFLPFILGLLGLFFQLKRDGRGFLVVTLLFFMTGLAIILYLNQTPQQPRERDYAYAASFYAFALWVGLGLLPLYEFLARKIKNNKFAVAISLVVCASVPVILAQQNWDDHDRSGRSVARDFGHNYLESTLPNSVIINYGDNDTFPIWYAQEVEGVRTDVRVMNASYISGDWYIDQMRVKANDSDPLPLTIPYIKYHGNAMRQFPVQDIPRPGGGVWTAKEVMAVVNSEDPQTKVRGGQHSYDFIPARRIAVPVNKANVIKSGIVNARDSALIEDTIYLELKKDVLRIDELLMIDLLANFDWSRPLHFTSATGMMDYGLLKYTKDEAWSYLQNDGITYRLVPIKSPITGAYDIGRVDTEVLYDNLMNKYSYGNIANPKVYVDPFVENTFNASKLRGTFAQLSLALTAQGDSLRAVEVLDRAMKVMPPSQLRYDESITEIIGAYWEAGAMDKGTALAKDYMRVLGEYVDYYDRFTGNKKVLVKGVADGYMRNLYFLSLTAQDHGLSLEKL
ncbi:MAG: DUF2723 domain-containing protein, partial [Mucinivorans sp.]